MISLLDTLIDLYILAVIVRVVLSWINFDPHNPFVKFLIQITEPVLRKIRQAVPSISGIDFSPMILILGLHILRNLLLY
ncbi:MAG: YggT family protein [Caldithrix sp.]|nr:MAG: YggT family protein [Caldithrix sp.]TDI93505.1 MAG: YggT family protein [Caldithrix sp.]